MKKKTRQHRITRREFVGGALAAAGAVAGAPAFLRARNLNDKLNIAMIGAVGRGGANMRGVASENIAVLCDVNTAALDRPGAEHPKAKRFVDFRKVFDSPGDFDAVVVSTCEHTHVFATMLALKAGKHVYCEKPLTHNIWEARLIRETASKLKLATQMGNQGHASDNHRRVKELILGGVIGPVREVHVWVNRAWGLQSEEAAKRNKDIVFVTDRPKEAEPVPPGLDWDLWLGPAPARPFHSVYFPGPKWYRWWDFGNGTMSDLGSHRNDLAFYALDIRAPLTVEATAGPAHPEITPATMSVTYEYAARGAMPPVKLTWHQGENRPKIWTDGGIPQWPDAQLFIGDKGMILTSSSKHMLLPEKDFAGFVPPPQTIPNSPGHYVEWIEACKGGKPSLANFEYAGWTTEANHLGNVAYRAGKKLHWDAQKMKATNAPEADKFIRREYRKGWEGILKG
ncbi:MAG: Gfo/Idh/MocA family protein [Acidobacteriota bacterium]